MADDQNPQLPLDGGTPPGGGTNLIPINIEEEMRRSYLDYSMSVIIGRALPDARDGLKPVHRRVLYTMSEMGLEYNKKYTKCAKVVGQAMGVYHPHGDSAIYDTLVRMAQPFSLRYPLVDGQGNFGSVDGDPPAAMRYTECRMERIAGELLADIEMETVDFVPNYDESTTEPTVLPSRIPNLILNGSSGIAVGMATNIPPHNLTEVVNAAIALVKNPKGGLAEVLKHVHGPDFPTGAILYGRTGIVEAYRTGRGRFLMRARVATENINKDRQALVVTELPYQVNKAMLFKRIAELAENKIINDVETSTEWTRDESDRDGMRLVIGLKRGAQPEIVLNQLFKHTQLQESFSMIFLAVVNGQPRELGLDQAIQVFIDHRIDVVQRRTVYLLRKAREREHILEGYKIALDNLDTVIRIIRASNSRADARDNLYAWGKGNEIVIKLDRERLRTEERGLTLRQIDAILELQLYRLTQLSIDEILSELKEIRGRIAEYEEILASEKKLRAVIVKELEDVRNRYGDERRTEIVDESAELQLEDLIADEQVAVTVSHQGYLKRTPISIYRQQRRGGSGRMGMKTREEDFVSQLIIDSTHAYLLCFTNTGRVYWLKVYEIPDVGAAGKGKSMQSLLDLQTGEKVCAILALRDLEEEGKFVFFATQKGTVKKTPLKDFSNVMSRGIIAIGIDSDDELVAARLTDGSQLVFLATHLGLAIRFDECDVRSMGRPAYGVRGIALLKNDYVVGVAVTPKEHAPGAYRILSVTENGFGKRTDVEEYRLQTRGGKGVKNLSVTERVGPVNTIQLVDDTSELMVISQFGKIIRIDTKTVRSAGRATQGVRLLSLEDGDKIAAAVIIPTAPVGRSWENLHPISIHLRGPPLLSRAPLDLVPIPRSSLADRPAHRSPGNE
ncbi:MAG: DNA gyrase subunit A [Terracidiphilus sp.]